MHTPARNDARDEADDNVPRWLKTLHRCWQATAQQNTEVAVCFLLSGHVQPADYDFSEMPLEPWVGNLITGLAAKTASSEEKVHLLAAVDIYIARRSSDLESQLTASDLPSRALFVVSVDLPRFSRLSVDHVFFRQPSQLLQVCRTALVMRQAVRGNSIGAAWKAPVQRLTLQFPNIAEAHELFRMLVSV